MRSGRGAVVTALVAVPGGIRGLVVATLTRTAHPPGARNPELRKAAEDLCLGGERDDPLGVDAAIAALLVIASVSDTLRAAVIAAGKHAEGDAITDQARRRTA